MAFINEEEIAKIRNSAKIEDIISSYIPINKKGNDYVAICPFHDDHSPSMSISTKLGIYKCFVCNAGGNVFTFVQNYEHVSYIDAVKIVAEKSGVSINTSFGNPRESKYSKEYELMDLSLKYFQNNLASIKGEKAQKYLNERGIDEKIITNYKFGLSLADNSLLNFLKKQNCDLEMAVSVGLLNKNGIDYFDVFTDRIMIPIFDTSGRLSGYTARAYLKDEKSKYINSKETAIYKKSNILFNYYKAKDAARQSKTLIIVEGNLDAITMSSYGYENVIALMGVIMSPYQIDVLKRLNSKIILMTDADNAGEIATNKLGDELYKNKIDTYVVRLSGAKDPDEYLRKYGQEALDNLIKHPMKYFDYKIEYLKKDRNLNQIEDLTAYIEEVMKVLENSSQLEKEITLSKISKEYGIDVNVLKNQIHYEKNIAKELPENVIPQLKKTRYELAVSELLGAMLVDDRFIEIYKDKLGYLKNKIERDLVLLIEEYKLQKGTVDLAGFLDYIKNYPAISEFVNNNLLQKIKENVAEKEFYDILYTVCKCIDEEEIKEIQIKLKSEQDINRKVELIEKLTDLKKGCGKYERN